VGLKSILVVCVCLYSTCYAIFVVSPTKQVIASMSRCYDMN
jgi:hypothetical protein